MIEFIKWCFKDSNSSFMTLIVIGAFFSGVIGIIKAIKKK
jgi:hypothetical protein